MQTIVISLGGSIITPDKIDTEFLKLFKKTIGLFKNYKFIIVCGGGKTARSYIEAGKKEKLPKKDLSLLGILSTRLNAELVAEMFHQKKIPITNAQLFKMEERIIVCGALGEKQGITSDANAADLAKVLKAKYFINMTNVPGLYTKDPKKNKKAKLIRIISAKEFYKITKKIKFEAGQHFILDQTASSIILKHKILTLIIRGNENLKRILENKPFTGTIISS
jgi:uridylate kinase